MLDESWIDQDLNAYVRVRARYANMEFKLFVTLQLETSRAEVQAWRLWSGAEIQLFFLVWQVQSSVRSPEIPCRFLWSNFGAGQGWLGTRKRNRRNDLD